MVETISTKQFNQNWLWMYLSWCVCLCKCKITLQTIDSKNKGSKCMFCLFFLFFSLKRTVSQTPYEAGFLSGFFVCFSSAMFNSARWVHSCVCGFACLVAEFRRTIKKKSTQSCSLYSVGLLAYVLLSDNLCLCVCMCAWVDVHHFTLRCCLFVSTSNVLLLNRAD